MQNANTNSKSVPYPHIKGPDVGVSQSVTSTSRNNNNSTISNSNNNNTNYLNSSSVGVVYPKKTALHSTLSTPFNKSNSFQTDAMKKQSSACKISNLLQTKMVAEKSKSVDPNQIKSLSSNMTKLRLTPKTSIDRVNFPKFYINLADRQATINKPVVFEVRIEKIYEIDQVKWTFRPLHGNMASGIHSEQEILESKQEDIQLLKSSSKDFTILTCVMGSFQPKYIGTVSVTISNKYGKATSKCICSLDLANDQFKSVSSDEELENSSNNNNNHKNYYSSDSKNIKNSDNSPPSNFVATKKFSKISSNNARLYNLSEEGDNLGPKKDEVKCQGYVSDVLAAVEEEHTFRKFGNSNRRISNTQQYLKDNFEK